MHGVYTHQFIHTATVSSTQGDREEREHSIYVCVHDGITAIERMAIDGLIHVQHFFTPQLQLLSIDGVATVAMIYGRWSA